MSQRRDLLCGPTATLCSSDILSLLFKCVWSIVELMLYESCMLLCFIVSYLFHDDGRLGYFSLNTQKQLREMFQQGSFMNFCCFLFNGLVG